MRSVPNRSFCRYTIPVHGHIAFDEVFPIQIDDLSLTFEIVDGLLRNLIVIFPVPRFTGNLSQLPNQAGGADELRIYEPRMREIEEFVLQVANGLSVFPGVPIEIQFDYRKIEWLDEHEDGIYKRGVEINFGSEKARTTPHQVAFELLSRSIIAARVIGQHDPLFTFYKRGAADTLSGRYIEAFYNFFFFLEYEYIQGLSNPRKVVAKLMESTQLVSVVEKVFAEKHFAPMLSPQALRDIGSLSVQEFFHRLVDTRGNLHHPNRRRAGNWSPERQRQFANEAIILYFICMTIALERCSFMMYCEPVSRGFKKVQRCLRMGQPIRVVTR